MSKVIENIAELSEIKIPWYLKIGLMLCRPKIESVSKDVFDKHGIPIKKVTDQLLFVKKLGKNKYGFRSDYDTKKKKVSFELKVIF